MTGCKRWWLNSCMVKNRSCPCKIIYEPACETSKCFISSFSNVARICFPVPKNSAWQAFCSVFSGAFLPNGFCKYSCMHCSIQFLLLSIEVPARLKAKCKWRRKFFAQVLLTGQLYHRLGTSLYSDADICSCVLQKGQRFDRIIPLLHLWYC